MDPDTLDTLMEPITSGQRVIILDDSLLTLEVARDTLETEGFLVRTAESIDEFDAILSDFVPDIIVTDVNMPELQGPELCRRLKSRRETAPIPIVLYSSLDKPQLDELASECDAQGTHSKNDGLDALPTVLRAVVEASQPLRLPPGFGDDDS